MLGAVLGLVQKGAWSGADPVATAERAATSLLGSHANCMSSSRRLLILEGMMTAANRSCNEGKSGDFWAVASQVPALLHTLVAAFGVSEDVFACVPHSHIFDMSTDMHVSGGLYIRYMFTVGLYPPSIGRLV